MAFLDMDSSHWAWDYVKTLYNKGIINGKSENYFDPGGKKVTKGQHVIVETGKGLEYGVCVRGNSQVEDELVVQPLRPMVRFATQQDEKQITENHRREKEAMRSR